MASKPGLLAYTNQLEKTGLTHFIFVANDASYRPTSADSSDTTLSPATKFYAIPAFGLIPGLVHCSQTKTLPD